MDQYQNQYDYSQYNPYPVNKVYIQQSYQHKKGSNNSNHTLVARVSANHLNYHHQNNNQQYKRSVSNNYSSSQTVLNQSQVINNSNNIPSNSQFLQGRKSHSSTLIFSSNTDSQVTDNNKTGGYGQNSGQISTKILHQKIHYLQRQLQQLTKLLQQQSRMSQSGGSNYQELAIENAQLTIKIQELEQNRESYKIKISKMNQQIKETVQQLQNQHQANNKLRQGLLSFQQKMQKMQNQLLEYKNQQNQQNSTSSIQNDIIKLNQQISDLLQKLHILNEEYNQQQLAKEEVMGKLNDQNLVVESLRRQISITQIKMLELKEQNNYLKDQITKIDQMSLAKQRQIQDKYIKQQVQSKYYYQKVQSQNHSLLSQVKSYERQIKQYENQVDALKVKSSRVSKSNVELNEQRLLGEIKNLQDQLLAQKEKENIIREKYSRIVQDLEDKIKQFQIQNRKLKLQIRKLQNQASQHKNTIRQMTQRRTQQESNSMLIQSLRYEIGQLTQDKNSYTTTLTSHESTIKSHESTIKSLRQRLNQIQNSLQQKLQELDEKQYLTTELHTLQQKHEQLLEQVKKTKIKNSKIQSQTNLSQRQNERQRESILANQLNHIKKYTKQLEQQNKGLQLHCQNLQRQLKKQQQVKYDNLHNKFSYNQSQSQKILKKQVQRLTYEVNKFIQWRSKIQIIQQAKLIQNSKNPLKCQSCQSVLRQFLIYKELQEIKLEYIIGNMNSNKKQSQNQEFVRQKIIYEGWIKEYSKNQHDYRVLQERVWEWQKLKAKNESLNSLKKTDYVTNYQQNQRKKIQHLNEIEYELNLIKIQNSSLRGQIQSLQQQIKQITNTAQINKAHKHKSSNQVQIKLLQEDYRFLQQENKKIKHQISELRERSNAENYKVKKVQDAIQEKQKEINHLKRQLRDSQTTIESLQNQFQYQHQMTVRSRLSTQQLQTGSTYQLHPSQPQILDRHNLPYEYVKYHPQHKKLQTQYIQLKRSFMQLQLHYKKQREFFEDQIKKFQIQKNYHKNRIILLQNELNSSNEQKSSLILVNNGIGFVPKNQKEQVSRQLEQLAKKFNEVQSQLSIKNQLLNQLQRRYEQLYSKYQKQKNLNKQGSVQSSNKKQRNVSDSSNFNIGRIQVSPIKSPAWEYYEHNDDYIQVHDAHKKDTNQGENREFVKLQEQCDLLKKRFNKYNQDVQKLRQTIDFKIMELNVTPRQPTDTISRAIWFIQRISTDTKQLKIDLEILKGQKKALMKQKSSIKEELQRSRDRAMGPKEKNKYYEHAVYDNHEIQEQNSRNKRNQYIKPLEYQESIKKFKGGIPKLNFAEKSENVFFSFNSNANNANLNNLEVDQSKNNLHVRQNKNYKQQDQDQNFGADVVNEADQLRHQRRNKLNKFKNQLIGHINNVKVH